MPWTLKTKFDKSFEKERPKQKKRRAGNQPIIHRYKAIPYFWPLDSSLKNKFKKPENLTIITISTYPEKTFFEQSLDYLGIAEYTILEKPVIEWWSAYKLDWIFEFLQSGTCKTEYLLYCDSRDVIVIDDLQKVIDTFKKMNSELIFCSTVTKRRGIFRNMPQLLDWTKIIAKRNYRYLNAGAFIGRTAFIQKVFTAGVTLKGRFARPNNDQDILRYLHPAFYPEMDIDYFNAIFYRN